MSICEHNSYWTTSSGRCVMCRLEKLEAVAKAAKPLVDAFTRMRIDHDEKLGKSFEEAQENFSVILQEPLEFGPLIEALSALEELK